MKEAPNVNLYEATTRGAVTACQNCSHVRLRVLNTSADRGMSTIRLRYAMVKPRVISNPGKTLAGWCRGANKVKLLIHCAA